MASDGSTSDESNSDLDDAKFFDDEECDYRELCWIGSTFVDGVLTITDTCTTCTTIPANECRGRADIKELVLPPSVVSIGDHAFYGCTGMRTVRLPHALRSIGDYAFRGCTHIDVLHLPDALESIGKSAFAQCTGVVGLYLPSTNVIYLQTNRPKLLKKIAPLCSPLPCDNALQNAWVVRWLCNEVKRPTTPTLCAHTHTTREGGGSSRTVACSSSRNAAHALYGCSG